MFSFFIFTLANEQDTLLLRSWFSLRESIQFLDSIHQMDFIESNHYESMKLLTELEGIENKMQSLIVNDHLNDP